jgi:hypothetical protein
MEPAIYRSSIGAVWADALFVSVLQRYDQPSAGQVQQAIATAMRVFGPRGCAERVAQEFGDHPEIAVTRMRWARELAARELAARELAAEAISRRAPEVACALWRLRLVQVALLDAGQPALPYQLVKLVLHADAAGCERREDPGDVAHADHADETAVLLDR